MDSHWSALSAPIFDTNGVVLATVGLTFPTGEMKANKDRFIETLKQTVARVREKFLIAN